MGQSAEGVEQDLSASPRRGHGRDVDDQLSADLAQAPVDVGFIGELFFEKANTEARQDPFQSVELVHEVHGAKVGPRAGLRNLVVPERELVRWRGFDSPSKTVDR